MTDFVIEATGVGKRYKLYDRPNDRLRELFSVTRRRYHREFWALRDFEMKIERGECVGLIGDNGAGKSTALKILARKLRPSTGTVRVGGRLSSILELGTGFHPNLTGRQNAFVNALFMGLHPLETDRHVDRMLEFAELGEYADQPLATYSSGMQARLAFASLVTVDPEVLILDEALATGDARFAAKGQEHLRKLCDSGCTTLIASHDLFFLENACDRVIWIDHGRIRLEGAPSPTVNAYHTYARANAKPSDRPKQVLVKIEPADPAFQGKYPIYGFQWLDPSEKLLAHYGLADTKVWALLLDAASNAGFSRNAASAAWGEVEVLDGQPYRACRSAFIALPLPPAPQPLPTIFKVAFRDGASTPAVFSLLVNGELHEIGRAAAGAVAGHAATTFPVSDAFKAAAIS